MQLLIKIFNTFARDSCKHESPFIVKLKVLGQALPRKVEKFFLPSHKLNMTLWSKRKVFYGRCSNVIVDDVNEFHSHLKQRPRTFVKHLD